MLTDAPPRKNRGKFEVSDRARSLELPADGELPRIAMSIEKALRGGVAEEVRRDCAQFLSYAADFYKIPACTVHVLAARPLRVREYSTTELFGDYHPSSTMIRVWMRTAIRKNVTSFGTFLSTLCHEFCHHLDFQRFHDSWHTRGFYERTAVLYHYSRSTPVKRLFWIPTGRQRWRIDWRQMRKTGS